jgi:predicted MFS family arabinose efflux permease
LVAFFLSPFFGVLIDRYGTRRLAIPGMLLTSFAVAAFGMANGSIFQWLALWLCYSLVSLSIKSTIWTSAVAGVFQQGRGLALGVTLSGTAAAQVVGPPLVNWLITEFGWQAAYAWMGFGWGGIALLLCVLYLYDAHDVRLKDGGGTVQAVPIVSLEQGLTVAQAWRDSALWRIALSTLIMMIATIGIVVHQFPILTAAGVTRSNAALLVSLGGFAGIAGKLVTGALLDRHHAKWVGGATLALTGFAYPLLLDSIRTPALIVVAMIINGYASGTKIQICGYLTTRYAGMRNFGTIFGFMASVIALGSGVGPWIAGKVFDIYGDYSPFLIAATIGSLLSGLIVFSLGRYPDWKAAPAERQG